MEVPQIWTRVPYGAKPLREEFLPQRNAPGRCCREGNEFGKPGLGGPMGRDQQDLLLILPELSQYLCECVCASVPRGPSVREKYSWQWEDSGEANRSI